MTLENELWQLDIVPDVGASVYGLRARVGGAWHPVMRPTNPDAFSAKKSSACSSFTLAPFSNRIRDARFAFAGREYQLKPTSPDGGTQHGDVRNRPWKLAELVNVLEGAFDLRDVSDFNFPFPFAMSVDYALEGSSVTTRLRLTNTGNAPMPAGFGIHPYFVRRLGDSGEALVSWQAGKVYRTDNSLIPDGPAEPVPPELDFATPREVGQQALNHTFTDWDGTATVEWPGSGVRLRIAADPVFSHLVAFTAPDGTLALEPVTNATDGFNLMARGVPGTGVVVLEPGESMSGVIRMTLEVA